MEARLQKSQKIESIGTLSVGIAHDFNNILYPIMDYSEILLDDLPAESAFRNYVSSRGGIGKPLHG